MLSWWRPPFLYRHVLLTTISDPESAFRGVIWQARGPWIVMKHAALVKANAAPMPIDGEIVIHRSNLAFIQMEPSA